MISKNIRKINEQTLRKFGRYFPINDLQTPASELLPISRKMRTVLNLMKNYVFIFPIFSFWVIYNLQVTPGFSSVSPIKKKVVQKCSNLQKICVMSWNKWKINFLTLTIFIFWVNRKMNQFLVQQRPYLKN